MTTDLTGGLPPQREQVLVEVPDRPGTRDAVNVWIEEANAAFGMRIGIEATAPKWDAHEIWLDIAFADGRVISLRDEGPRHDPHDADGRPAILGAGPLRFQCVEPFTVWTCSYHGSGPEVSAQNLIDQDIPSSPPVREVSFEIEMRMAVPPWVPGSLLADAGAVLASGEQGEFMSPRYEQLFHATGRLRVGDDEQAFTGNGLRIRRQGWRKFEGFSGHCWQSAVFPDSRAFGYIIYPPRSDGQPNYAEGFVYEGSGVLIPARPVEVPWMTRLLPGDEPVPLVLETAHGRIEIDGRSFVNTRSRGSAILPKNFPVVQQAHARYRWDGLDTVGMMERSSTPDKLSR